MVEEPMNSNAPLGGGFVRSPCSKAEISFSQRAKLLFVSTQHATRPGASNKQAAKAKIAEIFMRRCSEVLRATASRPFVHAKRRTANLREPGRPHIMPTDSIPRHADARLWPGVWVNVRRTFSIQPENYDNQIIPPAPDRLRHACQRQPVRRRPTRPRRHSQE